MATVNNSSAAAIKTKCAQKKRNNKWDIPIAETHSRTGLLNYYRFTIV